MNSWWQSPIKKLDCNSITKTPTQISMYPHYHLALVLRIMPFLISWLKTEHNSINNQMWNWQRKTIILFCFLSIGMAMNYEPLSMHPDMSMAPLQLLALNQQAKVPQLAHWRRPGAPEDNPWTRSQQKDARSEGPKSLIQNSEIERIWVAFE